MRLRIVHVPGYPTTRGKTTVTNADTGEKITGILAVSWFHVAGKVPFVRIDVRGDQVDIDVEGELKPKEDYEYFNKYPITPDDGSKVNED